MEPKKVMNETQYWFQKAIYHGFNDTHMVQYEVARGCHMQHWCTSASLSSIITLRNSICFFNYHRSQPNSSKG